MSIVDANGCVFHLLCFDVYAVMHSTCMLLLLLLKHPPLLGSSFFAICECFEQYYNIPDFRTAA